MNASENFAVSYVISRDSGSRHAGNASHHPARASKVSTLKTADRVLGVHGFVSRSAAIANEAKDSLIAAMSAK